MSKQEIWNELVVLDYILTWNYTDNYEEDLKRQIELRVEYDRAK